MLISLEEGKQYLRLDSSDEDLLLQGLIKTAESLILDVTRLRLEELPMERDVIKTAALYAVAYLFEHREEADHKELIEMLRCLLFSVRKEEF
jgi:uncharacterized phage protein (predicted DNA packaging)